MRVDVLTVFPEMFKGPFSESILKRAQEQGLVEIHLHDIRSFTTDRHRTIDEPPYGGGPGMVMKPEPVRKALEFVKSQAETGADAPVIMMTPGGRPFSQAIARELAQQDHLILLCGHYEGIDERVRAKMVTDEISIGDYVLTGGELPAMVVVDAAVRLIPGVLGDFGSTEEESFGDNLLEYPQYTRPPSFEGLEVPQVLRSGDHESISRWRRKESLRTTVKRRPDLLGEADLNALDRVLLDEIFAEEDDGLGGES